MLKLSKATYTQHDLMGSQSPLLTFDMIGFNQKIIDSEAHLITSRNLHAQGEDQSQLAWTLIGIFRGQSIKTEGTLYFQIGLIRKQLLVSYQGIEEQISEFGFNVVIKGNKVRISIPTRKPDAMLYLAERIYAKHTELGAGSPLNAFDMAAFNIKTIEAKGYHEEAKKLHEKAEGETQLAHKIVGSFKGQNIRTKGTLYNILGLIRTHLLVVYQGNEEKLSLFGFNVVITTSSSSPDGEVYDIIMSSDHSTAAESVTITLEGEADKPAQINWDDGIVEDIVYNGAKQDFTHTYTSTGIFNITVKTTNNLLGIVAQSCKLTAVPAFAPELTKIVEISMPINQLTTFPDISTFVNIKIFNLFDNYLEEVDSYIITINTHQTNDGQANLSGINNALPNSTTIPIIQELISRGWIVTTGP